MNGCASDLENKLCPACGHSQFDFFTRRLTPYLDQKEIYEIYTCRSCGHGICMGLDDFKYLERIYSDQFFDSSQQDINDSKTPININAVNRARNLSEHYAGNLLEIGTGKGAFLCAAQEYFTVEGVEFSELAAKSAIAKGFTIHQGDFLSLALPLNNYDLITLWDVMASLHDPKATLKKCYTLLKEKGDMVLTLPMIDSLIARTLKSYWALMIPPVNLHYFTEKSLKELAKETGFTLTELRYEKKKVSLQFIAIKASRAFCLTFLQPLFTRIIPKWNISLNTYDIATITLKKRDKFS